MRTAQSQHVIVEHPILMPDRAVQLTHSTDVQVVKCLVRFVKDFFKALSCHRLRDSCPYQIHIDHDDERNANAARRYPAEHTIASQTHIHTVIVPREFRPSVQEDNERK